MKDALASKLLDWAGAGALTVSRKLEEFGNATREGSGKMLAQMMSPGERERFSMSRYSGSAWAPEAHRGLPAWERAWFERTLPQAPARLLVAACGTGRELLPLHEKGYALCAFDGAEGALKIARSACPPSVKLARGTFRQLIEATQGSPNALAEFTTEPFDAVLLGWGSLTHVAGRKERRAVLEACSRITRGPILTSFYSCSHEELAKAQADPFVRWGRRWAGYLGRDEGPSVVEFSDWGGFAEYIPKEELALHAAALGRNVEWDESSSPSFPHVTLSTSSM